MKIRMAISILSKQRERKSKRVSYYQFNNESLNVNSAVISRMASFTGAILLDMNQIIFQCWYFKMILGEKIYFT